VRRLRVDMRAASWKLIRAGAADPSQRVAAATRPAGDSGRKCGFIDRGVSRAFLKPQQNQS